MILVDSYNVLHTPRALRELPDHASAEDLAGLIAVSRYRRRRAVLIYDGGPPPGGLSPAAEPLAPFRFRVEGVEVLFAGPGHDADSLIETMLQAESAPGRLVVVSSDRRLVRAAGRAGAASIPSETFVSRLLADGARAARAWQRPSFTKQVPLTPDQTRYWAKVLGVPLEGPSSAAIVQPQPVHPRPHAPPEARQAGTTPSRTDAEPQRESFTPPYALDPLLRAALEEWRGRLHLDDLDMQRWMGDTPPDRSDGSSPRSPRP
ncbi:MAG: NYN domain-containing protein [Phycisphaerales bacterium]